MMVPTDILADLPTPCLLVDVQAAERNIRRAAALYRDHNVRLRPHFKAHKCTELLRRQLDGGGCVGVTCQTSWEAATLATDQGMPAAATPGVRVLGLSDEHARVLLDQANPLAIGDPVLLVPSHLDPTVNLNDTLFAYDRDLGTLTTWPVDGRRRLATSALVGSRYRQLACSQPHATRRQAVAWT